MKSLSKKENLQNWLEKNIKHKESIKIIRDKVPIGQLTYSNKNGYLELKSGEEIINGRQLFISPEHSALLKLLETEDTDFDLILAFYNKNILTDIFKELTIKMKKLYPYYTKEYEFLNDNIDNFVQSSTSEKVDTLQQLLKFLSVNSTKIYLSFNGIKKKEFGRKRRNNGLELGNTDLIYQSVTGLYETRFHID